MPSKKQQNQPYSALDLEINLTHQEHVRKRPQMYVGGTGKRAMHLLLWQIVDEAIHEHQQFPNLTEITITLLSDTRIRVSDNGLGIPTEMHKSGKSILDAYMTDYGLRRENYTINRSNDLRGKFHAIHMFMLNALTSECIAESKIDGYVWRQSYQRGVPITKVEQVRPLAEDESTGTSITFTPDFTVIDEGLIFDYDLIVNRCQELAYMLPEITFHVQREGAEENKLHESGGVADWLAKINQSFPTLHPILSQTFIVDYEYPFHEWIETIKIDLAIQFRDKIPGSIQSYVNTYKISGEHATGLRKGLLTAIYGQQLANMENPLYGLSAILHVYHPNPDYIYHGANPELHNREITEIVSDCVQLLLLENPDALEKLQNHFRV